MSAAPRAGADGGSAAPRSGADGGSAAGGTSSLDTRAREAWAAALADALEAQPDVLKAVRTLGAAGPGSLALARAVSGALQSGRNLAAALATAGCITPAEAEALRALDSADLRAPGLRLVIDRRRRRRTRIAAMIGAAVNPLALTLVTLLGLQAPLLVLDAVTPGSALRPALYFLGAGLALAAALVVLVTRGGPTFWARLSLVPGLHALLARNAEAELAHALAALSLDATPTSAALTTAAALIPLPAHSASLRSLAELANAGGPVVPGAPWHPAVRLAVLGGCASGRLRGRCQELAVTTDAALTSRLVLGVRLLAYLVMFIASSLAIEGLMSADIKFPGLESLPGLEGLKGLDLSAPLEGLDKLLEQEFQ